MEFDHLDPAAKLCDVAVMVGNQVRPSKIFAEISKCDLLCANCHRIRTFDRKYEIKRATDIYAGPAAVTQRRIND